MSHSGTARKRRDQRPPALALRVRLALLAGRFLDMAPPAEGLQVRGIVGRPAPAQRHDVIALKAPGPPALPAAVAIAAEHRSAKPRPSAPVEHRVQPGPGPAPAHIV